LYIGVIRLTTAVLFIPGPMASTLRHQVGTDPVGGCMSIYRELPAGAIQLLDEHGELRVDPPWPSDSLGPLGEIASIQECREHYRQMRRARRFDQEAFALQRHGELGLWAQCLGQEAAQIGSISALRPSDYVFPTYREHAAALYRAITPEQMLAQWRGVSGNGWDPAQYRFHAYTVVLAAQLPHATGYAMGIQRDGTDEVVLAYFGDGASSQGDAGEAFNWAAAADLPVLFFCQNNQWAISTPTSIQMRAPLHQRARGYGLQSYLVDGNDVLAVHAVTRAAVEQIRAGGGPALIEAVTYRMGAHTSSDDPKRYRDSSEVDGWAGRDPIARLETLLKHRGWMDETFRSAVDSECEELAVEVRRACHGFGPVDLADLFGTVLAEETPLLAQERRQYMDFSDSLAD
jgi:2-oxoisovalerate dehydrogenase E1 component alpha subunit